MSIPFHLDSTQVPYNFLRTDGMTDVNTIISDFRAQVVTGLSWTEPSTALFKTPIDAASRFLDVLLTRISATNLELRVRNQTGATIMTRRIQIVSGGSVNYYCNTYGFIIESLVAAQSEVAQGHVLDLTPDGQGDHSLYVVAGAFRSAADTNDNQGQHAGDLWAMDNGAATYRARIKRCDIDLGFTVNLTSIRDITGGFRLVDQMVDINFSTIVKWAGRVCHSLIGDISIPYGSIVRVNIDDATQAQFRVIGLLTAAQAMRTMQRCG